MLTTPYFLLMHSGRAYHHLGLVHLASNFYDAALKLVPAAGAAGTTVDFKREAAFNLSLIYKESGNTALARHLLHTYCTI